jgi:hypothetical protein
VEKDIAALQAVLTHPKRCGYLPEHVKSLTGKEATRQGILDGLEWLQGRLREDSSGNATAFLHYSGHGWRDETTNPLAYYLVPYDVSRDNLRSSALRSEDFAGAVKALNPRRLLIILDCCHAAGIVVRNISASDDFLEAALPTGLLMDTDAPPTSPAALGPLGQGHGRAVLSSSQGEQPSYNRRDGRMGIFTYHLIAALTGHARPEEGSAEILVSDVMSYIWRRVPESAMADWGQVQQPEYQVSGNFPVAVLLGGQGLDPGKPAPDPLDELPPRTVINTAGGDYVGRNQVIQGDRVQGDKVGGDKITVGDISGTGIVIGRNASVSMSLGAQGPELDRLFTPVFAALQSVPSTNREAARRAAEALQAELAQGSRAEDSRVARLLDQLAVSAPQASQVAARAFASPPLAALVGPVTKFVLEKINSNA